MTRHKIRRIVAHELRRIRVYRRALHTPGALTPDEYASACAWIKVGEDTLTMLREEPQGDSVARYADELFGITHRPRGNARFVNSWATNAFYMSEDGLRKWREAALYNASILAVAYGAIDLSDEL